MHKKGDRKLLKRKIKGQAKKFDEIHNSHEEIKMISFRAKGEKEDKMALTEESIHMDSVRELTRMTQPDDDTVI